MQLQLLEIERELTGEHAQEALDRYDNLLCGLDARLKSAMTAGMPPEEYTRCQLLADAVPVARKLIRLQMRGAEEN